MITHTDTVGGGDERVPQTHVLLWDPYKEPTLILYRETHTLTQLERPTLHLNQEDTHYLERDLVDLQRVNADFERFNTEV